MYATEHKVSNTQSKLLDQLKESEEKLEFSSEDTLAIIKNIGGITNLMKLCLENKDYYDKNLSDKHFSNLNHLITPGNDNDDTLDAEKCNIGTFDEKLRYTVDGEDNLYFKILPHDIASKIYHGVLLSYWYPTIYAVLFVAAYALEFLIEEKVIGVEDSKTIESGIWIALHTIGLIVFVSYLLGANIRLIAIVGQSFTFWFKMYNLLLIVFAEFGLYLTHDWSWQCGKINRQFCFGYDIMSWIVPYTTLFLIDTIYMHEKIKIMVLTALASLLIRLSVQAFLYADASYLDWNPFHKWNNSKGIADYTTINFKNIYVASVNNLIIFLITPLIVRLAKRMKLMVKNNFFKCCKCCKCCNKNKNNGKNDDINDYDKSFTVKKRTHFRWTNVNKQKSCNWCGQVQVQLAEVIHNKHQVQESGDGLDDGTTVKCNDSCTKLSKRIDKKKENRSEYINVDLPKSSLHPNNKSVEISEFQC